MSVSPTVPNGETVYLEDASNGNAVVGSGTLTNGSVVINVSNLATGSHNIFAAYGGDSTYASSQSSTVTQVVNGVALLSVFINANTAPILSLNVSGNLVTVTTGGNTTFAVGQPVLIFGSSVAADDGSFLVQTGSAGPNTFTYLDNNTGIANATGGTATVDGGTGSLGSVGAGSQRSMVDTIVYTFSAPVPAPTVNITVHAGQTGTVPTVNVNSPDGGLTWVVTFSGAGVVGNSIADGVFDITLTDGAITRNDTFYRLFGDINGDGQVNSLVDFSAFKAALGSSNGQPAYVAAFDSNADGQINSLVDYAQFKLRLGRSFTGFTATI